MGSAKRLEEEKKASKRASAYQRKIERVTGLEQEFANRLPNLFHTIERGLEQCLEVKFLIREGGEWMGIAKVEGHPRNMVCFSFAETFFECVDGLNVSISQDKWRVEKDWKAKGTEANK